MSLRIHVLTVFPQLVETASAEGMVRIAREQGALHLDAVDLRAYTDDAHRTTDDAPYGGGGGMVMKVDPVVRAWRDIPEEERGQTYFLSPRGKRFDQATARAWSTAEAVTLVCGRYQGLDERALKIMGAQEISLGDFVLAGGELAAAVMVEAVARLLPGVLGDEASRVEDSFEDHLLGFPIYTRPESYEEQRVPEVLLSGDHARIAAWRRNQRVIATFLNRPDLLERADLTPEEKELIQSLISRSETK